MSELEISLHALSSRDVTVQWFEGVTLVQTVCRQILARNSSPTGFPPPSHILLSADGFVTVLGSSWVGNPVESAARLLVDLQSGDVPVQLRLLLTQAAGADGAYPTLNDFSTALAYFERSEPQRILQQLFERAGGAPGRVDSRAQTVEPAPVEKAKRDRPDQPAQQRKPRTRTKLIVTAATVAALMAAAAWFGATAGGHARLTAAMESVKKVIGSAPENVPVEAGNGAPTTPGQKQKDVRRAAVTPRTQSHSRAIRLSGGRIPFNDETTLSLTPFPRFALSVPPSQVLFPAHASYDIVAATPGADPDRIYSKSDSSVVPPRQVYPALPPPPEPGTRLENFTVLDLVVTTDGFVERVHMRTRPRDVHEFMLLSAAKAWRFEPATLGGRPVRFQHSVAITGN